MLDLFLQMHEKFRSDDRDLFAFKTALLKFFFDHGYYFDVQSVLSEIYEDFSLNKIITLWADREINLLQESTKSLNAEEREAIDLLLFGEFSCKESSGVILSELYESLYSPANIVNSEITDIMAEVMRKDVRGSDSFLSIDLQGGRLLSNAYDALMNLYFKDTSSDAIESIHKKIIADHLYGMDSDTFSCVVTKIVLALKYKRCVISDNIVNVNSPVKKVFPDHYFDWLVANLYGRYDKEKIVDDAHILTTFFKEADVLAEKGRLLLSLDQRFNSDPSCRDLRKSILDEYQVRHVFLFETKHDKKKNPMIYTLQKGVSKATPIQVRKVPLCQSDGCYRRIVFDVDSFETKQSVLNDQEFRFSDVRENNIVYHVESRCTLMLEDLLDFHQGLITGCDKAFVVQGDSLIYSACIDECGVPWVKGKHITDKINFYGQYLLYTNDLKKIDQYPNTMKRLELYKKLLEKRRECQKGIRQWYELQWGREREFFTQEKMIFPSVSDRNRFVLDDQGYFFGADISAAVLKKEFKSQLQLRQIIILLNSPVYQDYILAAIKKIGPKRYAYYPNEIKKIMIPPLDVIGDFESEKDVEKYFSKA